MLACSAGVYMQTMQQNLENLFIGQKVPRFMRFVPRDCYPAVVFVFHSSDSSSCSVYSE